MTTATVHRHSQLNNALIVDRFTVYTAAEYYRMQERPLGYIVVGKYSDYCEVLDIDENMTGTEHYVAFKDAAGQIDWVNATNMDILVEE